MLKAPSLLLTRNFLNNMEPLLWNVLGSVSKKCLGHGSVASVNGYVRLVLSMHLKSHLLSIC